MSDKLVSSDNSRTEAFEWLKDRHQLNKIVLEGHKRRSNDWFVGIVGLGVAISIVIIILQVVIIMVGGSFIFTQPVVTTIGNVIFAPLLIGAGGCSYMETNSTKFKSKAVRNFILKIGTNAKKYGLIYDEKDCVMDSGGNELFFYADELEYSFGHGINFFNPYMVTSGDYIYSRNNDKLGYDPIFIPRSMITSVAVYNKLLIRLGRITLFRCAEISFTNENGEQYRLRRIIDKYKIGYKQNPFVGIKTEKCVSACKKPAFVFDVFS